jgi:hypothetical protein
VTFRYSPCDDTPMHCRHSSSTVTTGGVSLTICKNILFVSVLPCVVHSHSDTPPVVIAMVAAAGVSVSSHGCSIESQRFLVPKRCMVFWNLKHKISHLIVSKKHRQLCRKARPIVWYPSWPPSFVAGQYLPLSGGRRLRNIKLKQHPSGKNIQKNT